MSHQFRGHVVVKALKLKDMITFKQAPTIKGVDMQIFQRATVDEKVLMIPQAELDEIKLEKEIQISDGTRWIRYDNDGYSICAKINGLSKCLSGIDHKDKSFGDYYSDG